MTWNYRIVRKIIAVFLYISFGLPLHSLRFQKMKYFVFLKVGDYMKTITRAKYLDRIIELNGTPDIKIITGIRRSGKSKLMQAYIAYLKSNLENINIIFIDFMDLAYEEIKEYHALHALSLIHISEPTRP